MTKEYTFFAGHFGGHANAFKLCIWHCLMQYVQGYIGSLWMPPLGNKSLCITPVAARATGKQTRMKEYTYFAGRFNGHGIAPVCYCAHYSMKGVQSVTKSHWMPPLGEHSLR
jgi:hypothetical protein